MAGKKRKLLVCRSCGGGHIGQRGNLCPRCWRKLKACMRCFTAERTRGQSCCQDCVRLARIGIPRTTPWPDHEQRVERYAERAAKGLPLFED